MEQFANNADSTLNGAINNSTTTIVVADGSVFPSLGDFRLIIGSDPDTAELIKVTARSGNTLTVVRGQENTTAQSWGSGTTVTHILTAGAIITLRDALKGKTLHSSLETIGASQDGYALAWSNTDGYWAARPGSPFTISGNELNTTRSLSLDANGTFSSSHTGATLYVNGNIQSKNQIAVGEVPFVTRGFSYVSDAVQSFTVPTNVTSITVKMWGPGGGSGNFSGGSGGGAGGYTTGALSVTPGETLFLVVGSGGKAPLNSTANGGNGGWPGGGFGTRGDASGGGGGGYTGIFTAITPSQANALAMAGGGGGSTGFSNFGAGGGGGLTGGSGTGTSGRGGSQVAGGADGNGNAAASTTIAAGSNGVSLPQTTLNVASTAAFPTSGVLLVTSSNGIQILGYTGKNATQFTGVTLGTGTLSTGNAVVYGIAGSALTGGVAYQDQTSSQPTGSDCGGGGSGYFGGGAGQADGRSGGGGSGFLHATRLTNASTTTGNNAANGNVANPPPNNTDANYVAGVGVGAQAGSSGGDGYIVFQWGGQVTVGTNSLILPNRAAFTASNFDVAITSDGYISLVPATTLTLSGTTTSLSGSTALNLASSTGAISLTGNTNVSLTGTTGTALVSAGTTLTLSGTTDVRFNTASTLRGYFDNTGVLRAGPSATSAVTLQGATSPASNTDYLYVYNASGSAWAEIIAGGSTARSAIQILNNATTNTCGVSLFGASTGHATAEYAGNGIIEQSGNSTSALVFTKKNGTDGLSFASTGAIWQSGAWTIGRATNNDTSAEAQAGLTGPVLNISTTTGGTLTTVANQAMLYNVSGAATLQGNAGHNFITGTASIASTNATKFITSLGRRLGVTTVGTNVTVPDGYHNIFVPTLTAGITITLPASPTTGDTYLIKDRDGSATTFNITIAGNGKTIEQFAGSTASSLVLNQNYDTVILIYNGSFWSII